MHSLEAVGAATLGGGVAVAIVTGVVIYLARRGVQPVPNPYRPGDVQNTPERQAYLNRYNDRYVAIARIASRISLAAAFIGLVLLIVGSLES